MNIFLFLTNKPPLLPPFYLIACDLPDSNDGLILLKTPLILKTKTCDSIHTCFLHSPGLPQQYQLESLPSQP